MRKLLLPLAVLSFAACQPAGDQGAMSEAVDLTPVISARTSAFSAAVNSGNVDSIAMYYSENATLMPPNMRPFHGREGLKEYFNDETMMPGFTPRLELTTESVTGQGPIAIERGSWVATMTPGEGAPEGATVIADSGSYLTHWHEIDGTWLMVDDMWVSRLPARPAMEASKPAGM